MFMGMLYTYTCCIPPIWERYECGDIRTGVGFGVARSIRQGNAKASRGGTGNAPRFLRFVGLPKFNGWCRIGSHPQFVFANETNVINWKRNKQTAKSHYVRLEKCLERSLQRESNVFMWERQLSYPCSLHTPV